MRILGIDPGYERVGIAVLERNTEARPERYTASAKSFGVSKKEKVIFSECFKTSAKLKFEERLKLIGTEVKKIIKKYKVEVLAIETLFLNTNHKTVMHVAEARGVVIYEASCAGLRIFEASPPQIKIATTGYGKANKEQVMKMVKMLVEFMTPPMAGRASDDELDAIAIALTAFAHTRG